MTDKLVTVASVMAITLIGCANACNLYDASKPDTVFLCADQLCTEEGGKTLQCQSGCCHDGKCNNDGACAARQFYLSLAAIAGIFIFGVGVYFLYWYFRCRTKDPKNNLRFVEGADERPLAAADTDDD